MAKTLFPTRRVSRQRCSRMAFFPSGIARRAPVRGGEQAGRPARWWRWQQHRSKAPNERPFRHVRGSKNAEPDASHVSPRLVPGPQSGPREPCRAGTPLAQTAPQPTTRDPTKPLKDTRETQPDQAKPTSIKPGPVQVTTLRQSYDQSVSLRGAGTSSHHLPAAIADRGSYAASAAATLVFFAWSQVVAASTIPAETGSC